jgi:hypothetical protein
MNLEPDPDNRLTLPPKLEQAMVLITALCDDRITPDGFSQLQSLVCNDKEVRRFYVQMMHLHGGLYYFASAMPDMVDSPGANSTLKIVERFDEGLGSDDTRPPGMNESMVLPAMTETFDVDPDEELLLPGPVSQIKTPSTAEKNRKWIRGGLAAGLVLLLGLLAYILPKTVAPRPEEVAQSPPVDRPLHYVATMNLASKPVWAAAPAHALGFVTGDVLSLKSGAVQLRFNSGADGGRLVVEGPADVRFTSDSDLTINRGRIVAYCPGGGLVVHCPTGSVTDLGTEFGVSVDTVNGNSDVEVFQGRVVASLRETASTQAVEPMVLNVGQAATISKAALIKNPRGAIPQDFICSLAHEQLNSLDVTDLICGGDGTSHRTGTAIDSTTGAVGQLQPVGLRVGDGKYHPAHGFPAIDGAFVPDGSNGPSIIDSAGDRFQFTPTTNQTTNHIWTGGRIPWADELGISTVIEGVDYALPPHTIICTHCNNAITLDLSAIRRIYPDLELTRFHSRFANTYVNGLKGAKKINPVANVYVLIDGVSRYEKLDFTNQDGSFEIDIPVKRSDRFLTLAAVDDSKDIDRDWILWTDAKLELTPAK